MGTIAIFDSGVGGLTVYDQSVGQCPNHNYVFVSDNQAFPYGTKSAAELNTRVMRVVAALIEQYQPDLLVIACNTVSTVMLPALRSQFDLPIVGVVPAVKPASALSQTGVIGLLATPATIQRAYTDDLIGKFASDCQVVKVGSAELVQVAEDKLRGLPVDLSRLSVILEPVFGRPELDVLVLACTHFPLLKSEIELLFQEQKRAIQLVDSGAAVANRITNLLDEQGMRLEQTQESNTPHSVAVFTQAVNDTILSSSLQKRGFGTIQTLINA